jgi:hypothetical protein
MTLKQCTQCPRLFSPQRMGQAVCSPSCAMKHVRAEKKAERAHTRQRKTAIKKPSKLAEECRTIVQKIARIRDRNDGCISCHMGSGYQGQWHGSHFRSHGACSSLQFHLWNIHKACAQCNLHKSGNHAEYRPRLIEKIGQDRVDWLEAQPKHKRCTREYLYRLKEVMGKRLRRMEKRYGTSPD